MKNVEKTVNITRRKADVVIDKVDFERRYGEELERLRAIAGDKVGYLTDPKKQRMTKKAFTAFHQLILIDKIFDSMNEGDERKFLAYMEDWHNKFGEKVAKLDIEVSDQSLKDLIDESDNKELIKAIKEYGKAKAKKG